MCVVRSYSFQAEFNSPSQQLAALVSSQSQPQNFLITPHILNTVIFTVAIHEQSGVV